VRDRSRARDSSRLEQLRSARKVPVALILFNRPVETREVFARVAEYQPTSLLVVADGPRSVEEDEACREARAVADAVDWECEVATNFSEHNLGPKDRLVSGLNWVFERCEEAIVLEDDHVPARSFFPYCAELLQRFRDDERVMAIGGNNYRLDKTRLPYSYFFSRYPGFWGWAGWRRAWREYDETMAAWPTLRDTTWLEDVIDRVSPAKQWRSLFDKTYAGEIRTWDYQWLFTLWRSDAFCICPERNLVRNIGFGAAATHTTQELPIARFPAHELDFPLRHPPSVRWSAELDCEVFEGETRLMSEPAPSRTVRRLRAIKRRLHVDATDASDRGRS